MIQTGSASDAAQRLRVLVVVRDRRLSAAIEAILHRGSIEVVHCASVAALGHTLEGRRGEVVLLDWSMTDGLLRDAQRSDLRRLCQQVSIVLLVPSHWSRLVRAEDLGVARVLPKGCGSETLLATLVAAANTHGGG